MKHGDTFELPEAKDPRTKSTWVVTNCPEDTITHIVFARKLRGDATLGEESVFFLPELEKKLKPNLRLTEQ